jgi:ketosteroid isomerase-like protein
VAIATEATPPNAIPAPARDAIKAANEDWLAAIERQDAKTLVAPYDDDAVFVTRSGRCITGQKVIEQLYLDSFKNGDKVIGGRLVDDGLVLQGTLVIEWGHSQIVTQHGDAAPSSRDGNFLTVWRQTSAGVWKIIRNLTL